MWDLHHLWNLYCCICCSYGCILLNLSSFLKKFSFRIRWQSQRRGQGLWHRWPAAHLPGEQRFHRRNLPCLPAQNHAHLLQVWLQSSQTQSGPAGRDQGERRHCAESELSSLDKHLHHDAIFMFHKMLCIRCKVVCWSVFLLCSPSRTRRRVRGRTALWSWTASASSSTPRIAPTVSVPVLSSATYITMLCTHAGTRHVTWCWWVTCRTTSNTLTHLYR